ncbi:aspartate/glutamate racemase family protein [Photobacterium sp. 2_MG-2023]|uniref:aspartate/glutamate racemase family protein n=1 Tax=Photobacterium sp. 2_MG-2023 TaxID=3062663 RepID=UPI0026E18B96|nr:aspartate/glutamate racemase family protein [Photobacterium sp. 2_MG-2023]MDO6580192.1 aspartate/glutamate racemase family protein [Photobacterium sp. 2_MG-2023]
MKTIGLIGGMSWESTIGYYRKINQGVKNTLGGLHSAKILLHSVDFAPIEKLQHSGNWTGAAEILVDAAKSVESAGADFVLICTNTMHKVAPEVEQSIRIPLLHIADATGEELVKDGISKVGLLGTAFTMEQSFYKDRLSEKYGLEVVIPSEKDRKLVHDIIYNELCLGNINATSRHEYIRIVNELELAGVDAVILGCTEIGMLISQEHSGIPLYDTTAIHAAKAVEWAMS